MVERPEKGWRKGEPEKWQHKGEEGWIGLLTVAAAAEAARLPPTYTTAPAAAAIYPSVTFVMRRRRRLLKLPKPRQMTLSV